MAADARTNSGSTGVVPGVAGRVRPGALAMMFNPGGLLRFLRDPQASRASRVLAVFTVLYVISPVDLIPDWFVPIAGWLDDLGVATLALAWVASQAARYESTHPLPAVTRTAGTGAGAEAAERPAYG